MPNNKTEHAETTSEERELLAEFTTDFKRLVASKAEIVLVLSPMGAWCLLGNLQLALRHPENDPQSPAAIIARQIAMRLKTEVATTPALARVAARGWRT